jgi:hypothetical protein
MGHCDPAHRHSPGAGSQALVVAEQQRKLPVRRTGISHIICEPCGCESGYGLPPAVGECPCQCHDTARLWWSMRPWRAEA